MIQLLNSGLITSHSEGYSCDGIESRPRYNSSEHAENQSVINSISNADTLIDTNLNKYKLARLVQGKRKYIAFAAIDEDGKLKEKRIWLNEKQAKDSNFIQQNINNINELLAKGAKFSDKKNSKNKQEELDKKPKKYNYPDLFAKVLQEIALTLRPDSVRTYKSHIKILLQYCTEINDFDVNQKSFFYEFRLCLLQKKKSNTYCNAILSTTISMLNMLVDRGLIEKNNLSGMKQLRVAESMNPPFSAHEKEQIRQYLYLYERGLYHFTIFIHQLFIRRTELCRLKIKDIDLQRNTINISGEISKNKRNAILTITPLLRKTIEEILTDENKKNWYVFGKGLKPSATYLNPTRVSEKHRKCLQILNISSEKTLYTWKDTGIVDAYRAGVDIVTLQRIVRHSSLEELQKYLRSVGETVRVSTVSSW
jgi:integrase